jgi:spermidine/putrescine ABC transporter ATP-binding subunit
MVQLAAYAPDEAQIGSTRNGIARAQPLALDGISKRFGTVTALARMTLEVRPGELVSLLGPSGCGKTTTLRLIAGFDIPDTGSIRIGGRDVTHLPPNKRGLGMVFQNYGLFPHLTVGDNIAFGLRMEGVGVKQRAAQVARMLEMIRLPGFASRRISEMSGGQQQRVALARAIVTNPSVLLLDEPLGALDKNLREGMQFELKSLQRELGVTSVMVTHDQEEALTMSDRVILMNHGRILQMGSPTDVYNRPRNRFVAEFLGTANILACRVVAYMPGSIEVAFGAPAAVSSWRVPMGRGIAVQPGDACDVAIRPEKVRLGECRPDDLLFDGVVSARVFRGAQCAYRVDVAALGQSFSVTEQASSGRVYEAGDQVTLAVAPDDCVVLEPGADATTETAS